MNILGEFLRSSPVGVLFFVLGLGYLVGKTRIRGFEAGSVSGVLLVGLGFGHLGFEPNPTVQSMGFALFIFSVGLQAGPSFFSVIRQDGLKYLALAAVVAGTGFSVALVLARALGLEPGASAGMLAGGLTSSPTLAAAQEAVRSGQVPVPAGTHCRSHDDQRLDRLCHYVHLRARRADPDHSVPPAPPATRSCGGSGRARGVAHWRCRGPSPRASRHRGSCLPPDQSEGWLAFPCDSCTRRFPAGTASRRSVGTVSWCRRRWRPSFSSTIRYPSWRPWESS